MANTTLTHGALRAQRVRPTLMEQRIGYYYTVCDIYYNLKSRVYRKMGNEEE